MMPRTRDSRPTYDLGEIVEPVAQNYFPVNSRLAVSDVGTGDTAVVLNDRAQAGGSIRDGQMELLVHRRLVYMSILTISHLYLFFKTV